MNYLNQFMFPNQLNDMNMYSNILFYKQEIIKLIDEIIEIEYQNMANMQFMNPQIILQLYREKFEELTNVKLSKKNYSSNFNNMGMNPINSQMNFNQINNMNMMNMMNMMNNNFNQVKPNNVENLTLQFMLENQKRITIQCLSNDKLINPINNFTSKTQIKINDYDFFLMEKRLILI